jgi:hypothetical protein
LSQSLPAKDSGLTLGERGWRVKQNRPGLPAISDDEPARSLPAAPANAGATP